MIKLNRKIILLLLTIRRGEEEEELTGRMKARVFPEPVLAAPRISRPGREWGKEAV